LPLLGQGGGVHDRGDAPAVVVDRGGDLSLRWRIDLHRLTFGVYESAVARHPVGELQGVVTERCRERVAQDAPTSASAKLADQGIDRLRLVKPGSHDAERKRERQAREGA